MCKVCPDDVNNGFKMRGFRFGIYRVSGLGFWVQHATAQVTFDSTMTCEAICKRTGGFLQHDLMGIHRRDPCSLKYLNSCSLYLVNVYTARSPEDIPTGLGFRVWDLGFTQGFGVVVNVNHHHNHLP